VNAMSTVEFTGGPLHGTTVTADTEPRERFVVAGGLYLLGDARGTAPRVWEFTWRPNRVDAGEAG
jgi:hypothetical protein